MFSRQPWRTPSCRLAEVSAVVLQENCTVCLYSASIIWMGLVEVVVSDLPQSLIANTVESLLEVDQVII